MLIVHGSYWLATSSPGYVSEHTEYLTANEPEENLFFCTKCDRKVPIRASHCRHCNRCVLRKDHHCDLLGICVGMENHFFFLMFMAIEIIYDIWCIKIFKEGLEDGLPFKVWLISSMPCTFCLLLSFLMLAQPLILFPFHLFMVLINKTTWEIIKGRDISYLRDWYRAISPFSRGIFGNIKEFVNMRWTHPRYHVPSTEDEIDFWKEENACIANDKYNCC